MNSISPEGSEIELYDSVTGIPRTTSLTFDWEKNGQIFLKFSHAEIGDYTMLFASDSFASDGELRFKKRIATPDDPAPDWFYQKFIPMVTGLKINSTGTKQVLLASERGAIHKELWAQLANPTTVFEKEAQKFLSLKHPFELSLIHI